MRHQGPDETVPPGYVPNQYTRCPYCMAVFRVNQEKISARGGEVRCGACREVFNALDHAVEIDDEGGFRRLTRQETKSAMSTMEGVNPAESNMLEESSNEVQKTDTEGVGEPNAGSSPLGESGDGAGQRPSEQEHGLSESHYGLSDDPARPEYVGAPSTEESHAIAAEETNSSDVPSEVLVPADSDSVPSLSQPDSEVEDLSEAQIKDPEQYDDSSAVPLAGEIATTEGAIISEEVQIAEATAELDDEESSSPDYESTNSIDVISAYAQDPEWDKEWQEFSLQEVESTVLDSYMEHRSGSVLGGSSEINDSGEDASQPRNWFNADPDSLLDNNPFTADPAASQNTGDPKPSMINMGGVDQYIMDRPHPLASIFWFFVAVGFIVLLGLQVKYFFVERFAQDDRYRSYLTLFCKVARCELPPRRDAYLFTITNTRIDLHPEEPGALRISVKLLNQADFEQPYPELQLTLTDRVGRVVGRRIFDPEFYLSVDQYPKLAPGELGAVSFDLARPHEKAVGFVVDIVHRPAA